MVNGDNELREANQAVVKRFIDAINTWDADTVELLLAPEFTMEIACPAPGFASHYTSAAEYVSFFRSVQDFIEEERLHDLEVDTFASDPGRLVATYKSDMTFKTPPVSYSNSYVTLWRISDGKITELIESFDPIKLVEALGGKVSMPS